MTALLQLQEGRKAYAHKELFHDATFAINAGEHVGIIGPNGAGKSTLFKILVGDEELDGGVCVKSKQLRLGYLPQYDQWSLDQTPEDFLGTCEKPLWELKALGKKLGLADHQWEQPISELSGGYRMRVKLLALLGQNPNVLLLDEPTNYLDLESVLELEKFLQDFEGAFLLISHDREFLGRVTDHTLEIEAGEITKYNGNIEDYLEQKSLLRDQLERAAANQAARRAEIQKFVDRFRAKASKAKQAQARLRMLDKMEIIEVKAIPNCAEIPIPPPRLREGKEVIMLNELQAGYGKKVIVDGIQIHINAGMKVAVVGLNGAGKTTLLKTFAGELPPVSGERKLGHDVSIGYYAQHVHENLDPNKTVFQEMQSAAARDVLPQNVLDLAGALLFSGKDTEKKVKILSGGEKARVALGKILLARHPFLVLDEPTNHLDFYTVEALTSSLINYKGTVVAVSHDRSFIRRIATHIVEINNGKASVYPGTYDEYVWSVSHREERSSQKAERQQKPKPVPAESKPEPKSTSKLSYGDKKELETQLRRFERKAQEAEAKSKSLKSEIETFLKELENPHLENDRRFKISTEIAFRQKNIDEVETQWLEYEEQKESIKKRLQEG